MMDGVAEERLFEYVAWFRNESLPADDQDYEWPGVVYIKAVSAAEAIAWGDQLAAGCFDTFLRSYVSEFSEPSDGCPIVAAGEDPERSVWS